MLCIHISGRERVASVGQSAPAGGHRNYTFTQAKMPSDCQSNILFTISYV